MIKGEILQKKTVDKNEVFYIDNTMKQCYDMVRI